MQLMLNHPNLEPFKPATDLKAVVACDRSTNAKEVCALLERLARLGEGAGRLIYDWWNFETLTIPSLRKLAAREAAAADLIFIAPQAGPELPEEVIKWISQWLVLGEFRPRALVALLDSNPDGSAACPGIRSQLKKVAELGHMDFFARETEAKLVAALKRGSVPRSDNLSWRQELYFTNCRAEQGLSGAKARNL